VLGGVNIKVIRKIPNIEILHSNTGFGFSLDIYLAFFHKVICCLLMQLDDGIASDCEATRRVSYAGLQDGNHTFEVCTNGSRGIGCASYKWSIG
jgi:hypothetical protein